MMQPEPNRCSWCLKDDLYKNYHDMEWGVPVYDDLKQFEFLILETFQAGLSWYTVLSKRENFRQAFHNFNPNKMAEMTEKDVEALMANPGIIRNRAKINAAIQNAKTYLEIMKTEGSFSQFMWSFVGGKPLQSRIKNLQQIKSNSPESDAMSKELKKRGFAFTGTTVCYAHMQATGMVNDHIQDCFRYKSLSA